MCIHQLWSFAYQQVQILLLLRPELDEDVAQTDTGDKHVEEDVQHAGAVGSMEQDSEHSFIR